MKTQAPANHCDFVAERYRSSYATGSNKPLRMAACRLRDGSLRHPSSIGSVTCPLPWNPSAKGKGIPGSQPLRLCQPLAGDGITLASRQVGTMSSPAKADSRLRHPVGRWRALKPGYWFLSGVSPAESDRFIRLKKEFSTAYSRGLRALGGPDGNAIALPLLLILGESDRWHDRNCRTHDLGQDEQDLQDLFRRRSFETP